VGREGPRGETGLEVEEKARLATARAGSTNSLSENQVVKRPNSGTTTPLSISERGCARSRCLNALELRGGTGGEKGAWRSSEKGFVGGCSGGEQENSSTKNKKLRR